MKTAGSRESMIPTSAVSAWSEDAEPRTRWSPYSICYERLDKDEAPETAETLRRYCEQPGPYTSESSRQAFTTPPQSRRHRSLT